MNQNILFVCSANKQRSKTGEDYFSTIFPNLNFKSAGTNIRLCEKEGTNPVTEDLILWADIVFVMEVKHLKLINQNTSNKYNNKVINLSIDDIYKYYQKELINILLTKVHYHLNLQNISFEKVSSQMSEDVSSTILKWLVSENSYVNKGEMIALIKGDNYELEFPASVSGFVKIISKNGENLKPNQIICYINATQHDITPIEARL